MTPAKTATQDEARIRQVIADWTSAFCAKDIERLMSLYADDITTFDVKPPFQTKGKAAVRRIYEEAFPCFPSSLQIETRDQRIFVHGDVGVAHWLFRFTSAEKDHPATKLWMRATVGFERQEGRWRAVHEHISVPFDPETSQAVLTLDV